MVCEYCGMHQNIVLCVVCKKEYCNNRKDCMSHIVFHLIKNKHKEIQTDRAFGCAVCGDSNVFRLGFCNKDVVCRECSLGSWESLIQERCLIDKVAGSLYTQLDKKELADMEDGTASFECMKTTFRKHEYLRAFHMLIMAESEEEKKYKESLKEENVTMFFHYEKSLMGSFINRLDSDLKISMGDELNIEHADGTRFGAMVLRDGEKITMRIHRGHESVEDIFCEAKKGKEIRKQGFTVRFVWNPVSYKRMVYALYKVPRSPIFRTILKGVQEVHGSAPAESNFNESQKLAIQAALTRRLTLIQGPPGTGKTLTSAEIVRLLVRDGYKVLVVAPSNTAVDQLTYEIHKLGVKVLRVMSKNREGTESTVEEVCLHNKVKRIRLKGQRAHEERPARGNSKNFEGPSRARTLRSVRRDVTDAETSREEMKEIKKRLVESSEVITCTCITAGSSLFNKCEFPVVLIDEAVQATEPQSLVPLVYGCTKLILVGDHKQLGPTILNKKAARAGLACSLFERMLRAGVVPYLLTTQYRMHPELSEYPTQRFYGGYIKTGIVPMKRTCFMSPTFFYCSYGKEELSSSGTSFLNRTEAFIVKSVVEYFRKNRVLSSQIGVITFYEGQRAYLQSQLPDVEVANVDGYQGREKDFIVISLVRSNDYQGIGFVKDMRRVNVALTRAKYGLVIVGNPNTLLKNSLWKDLLTFYDNKGWIYEGAMNDLRPVLLTKRLFDFKAIADALYNT
jgi:regulator of nonsense transcripts 1